MIAWVIARGKERSTWYGLLAVIAALGWHLTPEQADAIGTIAMALFGLFEILRKEPETTNEIPSRAPPRVGADDRRADRVSLMLSDPPTTPNGSAYTNRDSL